jgi:molybdopterin synthase catalytic subunit
MKIYHYSEMRKLIDFAYEKWSLNRAVIVHRVGEVPIGETSVVILFSSPHRRDSLEAVSWAIDELKAKVPVWKKEYYENEKAIWKENSECCMPAYMGDHRENAHANHEHKHEHKHERATEETNIKH